MTSYVVFVAAQYNGAMTEDSLIQRLAQAIKRRRLVAFRYQDHDRLVAPYILGQTQPGTVALSGIQVAGTSAQGKRGWKNFSLRDIANLVVTGVSSGRMAADYNPNDPTFREYVARVERRNKARG